MKKAALIVAGCAIAGFAAGFVAAPRVLDWWERLDDPVRI